jgi:predicted transposase/invertase (TIGR01784 family)
VDDDLKAYFSDVVATVQLSNGWPSEIYILFEHKSGQDSQARLQVLKYMVLKWAKWIKDRGQGEIHLPIIIAVVVYHGKVKWRYSTAFSDLFRLPSDAFRPFIPSFEHLLHDISHVDEASFKASVILQIFLMLLKYIFRPELIHKLPKILSLLNELRDKERITEYLPIIIKYILSTGNLAEEKIKEAAKSVPGGENVVETTADRLRQEGRQEGRLEGRNEGRNEGLK